MTKSLQLINYENQVVELSASKNNFLPNKYTDSLQHEQPNDVSMF